VLENTDDDGPEVVLTTGEIRKLARAYYERQVTRDQETRIHPASICHPARQPAGRGSQAVRGDRHRECLGCRRRRAHADPGQSPGIERDIVDIDVISALAIPTLRPSATRSPRSPSMTSAHLGAERLNQLVALLRTQVARIEEAINP
jgi:hypothetical protein